MKKIRVRIWVFFFILLIPVIYVISNNWIYVKYHLRDYPYFGDEFKMIDPSTEIMHIKIGDYVADIPSNYFWRKYVFRGVWWHAPPERYEGDVINIVVTWPGLSPWSPEADNLFREPGGEKLISTTLSKTKNEDWPFHYFRNVFDRLELITKSNEAPGLLHYYDRLSKQDVFLEYNEPKHGMISYICDSKNSGILYAKCKCHFSSYNQSHTISYSFSRKHLSKWRQIDSSLKSLFNSFVTPDNTSLRK